MKRIIALSLFAAAAIFVLTACGEKKETTEIEEATEVVTEAVKDEDISELTENAIDAVITLTNGETIELELYPDVAPKTVANFVNLANSGFYEGTIFHRAIAGFVIQGGGYNTDFELQNVSETVVGEFDDNGIENKLHHDRGVLSMARIPSEPDSASTQFFIVVKDNRESLDGQYAAFGRVVGGLEVVDDIANSQKSDDPPAGLRDVPEELYEIESVRIIGNPTLDE